MWPTAPPTKGGSPGPGPGREAANATASSSESVTSQPADRKLWRPTCSPRSTDSSRKAGAPSASRTSRYAPTGVSRSAGSGNAGAHDHRRRRSPSMPRTVILGTARTPFGRLGGGLSTLTAPQLGIHAGTAALERAGVTPDQVGYVVMGEVLQAGVGMIPSRQVSAGVGCPKGVGSDTVNKVCASGMRAIAYGDLMIRSGEQQVVLAGGMESMSNAPYLVPKARFGYTMGDGVLVDHMTSDGLTSTFTHRIMAEENSVVSAEIACSREDQDAWALRSHERAVAAQDAGYLADEIVAVTVP